MVPATLLLKATDGVLPEQMVCDKGVAVTDGPVLTVMATVTGAPEQPFNAGVTVYTAVPAALPVVVRFCAMLLPLPAEPPDTPV